MTSDEQRAASGPGAGPTNSMTSHPASHAANGATDPDRLDRYWDATTGNGFQRAGAIALEPAHARTVDLLQTLTNDATAGIPADARARIWRETVATAAIPTRQESPVTASALPGSGPATPNLTLPASNPPRRRGSPPPGGPIPPGGGWSVPGGGGPSQPTGRTWWPRLQFAVAAALILGLFATILAPMDDGRVGLFGGIGDDATPTTNSAVNSIPTIGQPDTFTTVGGLVDLPASASGHTVTIDRILLQPDTTFELPAGSAYFTDSGSGVGTSRNPAPPDDTDESPDLDVRGPIEYGGSLDTDSDQTAIVTILRIAPNGTPPLTSTGGATVYPLTNYATGGLRFDSQLNVLFGNGPAPVEPEPVGPSAIAGDPTNLTEPGATMLLFAEQGSIHITASADVIEDPRSSDELPLMVNDLTIAAGETAVVSNPSLATIQQATSGEGAIYTAVFLAPPGLDRTVGRTYPNTAGGGSGIRPVPYDGDDYQIVLDRLTLDPGATAAFPAGTFRAVQWTGGGLATMISDDSTRPAQVFEERALNASFEDQGFRIAATGDTPVTLTLMSYLPAGASGETVLPGQEGLMSERLTAYTDPNPFDADHLQISFSAAEGEGFPMAIAPGIDLNLTWGNSVDTYALIRAEGGPIVLNRPARRIVDGTETTQIAAGEAVIPGETVRVDDLRDATLQGPTDGSPAGYTLVVVSPYDEPSGTGTDVDTAAPVTGLTPANLDIEADIPTDQPLNVTVIRHILQPGAQLTMRPNGDSVAQGAGSTDPALTLNYVVDGSGMVTLPNRDSIELANRSSDLAANDITTAGPFGVTAGNDGLTLYQIIVGTDRPALDNSGNVSSLFLQSFTTASLMNTSDVQNGSVGVQAILRVAVGLGTNDDLNLGGDSAFTVMTPLHGDALVKSVTGEAVISGPGDNAAQTVLTTPLVVPVGAGVLIDPGAPVRVAPADDGLSVLSVQIQAAPDESTAATDATPSVATPIDGASVAATPNEGTPVASDGATLDCDIAPRTIEEVLALYDEGVANPIDSFTLGHRDDVGTGTPPDDETAAGITYTLLRLAACQDADEQLQSFALYSDDALRAVLPLIFQTREELERLPEQSASQTTDGPNRDVSVSDIEVFADGRVGARVALDSEFAYVTFVQAPDGTWRIDLFDDSEQQGG